MSTASPHLDAVVLVPVKGFSEAKRRLAPSLSGEARAVLARKFANIVVDSAHDLPVAVVCNDHDVVRWAKSRRLIVLTDHGSGLNGAVGSAVHELAAMGARRVIIIHSDLPLAQDIRWLGEDNGITLVPDHRMDGTNAMSLPLLPEVLDRFSFSYGVGSFPKHHEQALALRQQFDLAVHVVEDAELSHDIDVPTDLDDILCPPPRKQV